MKAPSLHKVTESSSPHPNPPGHSLLEKLSPGRSTQCDLAESPPQPPASVASRNQSREDQPRMAVVASRPLDSCSAHAWSIPSRWSDGWTTNHPFSPVDPPCAPVVPLYRTHPHPHLPYHSSILNPTHMQPENVYRPVFVTGAERGALDATGKVAPTAHTAPHTPASQSLPLDLPRLHVNVAPNQPQQQQPQQQLASQGAASFPQQGVMFPEIAVFGQLDQSVPRMALLHPLHMQQHGAPGAVSAGERRVGAKSRSQSDYASRHLAAEQGRRTRINERLERLRTIVPHAERTNTATFLEQVYTHIEHLNARVAELKSEVEARDTTIQELMCSARAVPQLGEGLNGHENPAGCPQGLMKDDSVVGVELHDGGVMGGAVGGDPWMGLKDGMKRGSMEADQDASKRMRTGT